MEQFINDVKLGKDDLELNYDAVINMYQNEELAMYFGSSAMVKTFQDQGIDTAFLPFFNQDGEEWIMTTPYFQIALNKDLEQDDSRRKKAMKVLKEMLSEEAQNLIIADGQDMLSYSQDVDFYLTEYLKDIKPVIEENHMYIRIASNDFFSISKDVVSKMIAGEYDSNQAYQAFNDQLKEKKTASDDVVLKVQNAYSNYFHADGGNEAYSVMANTLRGIYGTDVLIAAGNSFTGNVLQADYTKKMAVSMIMPNSLFSYKCEITGAKLKELLKAFVEGCEGGFVPFNRGSLPVVSGISMEVKENDDGYILTSIKKDKKTIKDDDTFTVMCLATKKHMEPILSAEDDMFEGGDTFVKDTWINYVLEDDAVLAEPESYITLR